MGKFLALALLVGLSPSVYAASAVIEQGIAHYNAPEAVSVSTSAYTNVTSAATRAGSLTAVLIDNPSTNTGVMHGHIGNCTSTAVATTLTGPVELAPLSNGGYIALEPDLCLWLLSRAASAENVNVQGVTQRR